MIRRAGRKWRFAFGEKSAKQSWIEIRNWKLGKTPAEKAAAKQASNKRGKARAAVSNFRFRIEARTGCALRRVGYVMAEAMTHKDQEQCPCDEKALVVATRA
jgi:hypothetical protein